MWYEATLSMQRRCFAPECPQRAPKKSRAIAADPLWGLTRLLSCLIVLLLVGHLASLGKIH